MGGVGSWGDSQGAPTTQRPVLLGKLRRGLPPWDLGLEQQVSPGPGRASWPGPEALGSGGPVCRVLSGSAVGEGPSDSRGDPEGAEETERASYLLGWEGGGWQGLGGWRAGVGEGEGGVWSCSE